VGNVHKGNITVKDNVLNAYEGEMEINGAIKKYRLQLVN
jgi:hypothetical protein